MILVKGLQRYEGSKFEFEKNMPVQLGIEALVWNQAKIVNSQSLQYLGIEPRSPEEQRFTTVEI